MKFEIGNKILIKPFNDVHSPEGSILSTQSPKVFIIKDIIPDFVIIFEQKNKDNIIWLKTSDIIDNKLTFPKIWFHSDPITIEILEYVEKENWFLLFLKKNFTYICK